ncbi:hypothetical protein C8R45DRAFT_1019099 [Mycena sanguinolenta]|nr:hypothetical protein C8R45DRAFT_1019099 [Mycena sanguinolenta]
MGREVGLLAASLLISGFHCLFPANHGAGMSLPSLPSAADDLANTFASDWANLAGFSLLIWDHVVTFLTEVEYIWNGAKGPFVYLFLLNRYVTPLGFIVNLYAYLSPTWSGIEPCKHFVRYEGAMTMIGIHVVGLMMLIRINALYWDKRWVGFALGNLWVVMFSIQAWLLAHGETVLDNPASGVRACTMNFAPSLGNIASSSAWLPFLYDSIVLILTLFKTVPAVVMDLRAPANNNCSDGPNIRTRLFQDGIMYYSAIFAINAALIISAPRNTGVTASWSTYSRYGRLELLIPVMMMSRITLNLKRSGSRMDTALSGSGLPIVFAPNSRVCTLDS